MPVLATIALSACARLPFGAALVVGCGAAYDHDDVFALVRSPGGEWLAIGCHTNMGATDAGSTEVVVRRDVFRVLREQRTVFAADGLVAPQVLWIDEATLQVGARSIDTKG